MKIKKMVLLTLVSFLFSSAYADGAVNIDVTGPMPNLSFNINKNQPTYQFNNKAGKKVNLILVVAPTSNMAVKIQCWHGLNPVEEFNVQPGETSNACVTDDVFRIVATNDGDEHAEGTYSIGVE